MLEAVAVRRLLALGLLALAACSQAADLVVSGEVLHREERWDRRSNPLMGRPDFLIEVTLELRPLERLQGILPSSSSLLQVSAKSQKALLAAQRAQEGAIGVFELQRSGPGWDLLSFELTSPAPRPTPTVFRPLPSPTPLPFPENLNARKLRDSQELQAQALRKVAKRYGLREASVIFKVSHQGPMPPEGGYLFWGVKGKKKGRWHVWQPGYGLRPGEKLEDPHRHQK